MHEGLRAAAVRRAAAFPSGHTRSLFMFGRSIRNQSTLLLKHFAPSTLSLLFPLPPFFHASPSL